MESTETMHLRVIFVCIKMTKKIVFARYPKKQKQTFCSIISKVKDRKLVICKDEKYFFLK